MLHHLLAWRRVRVRLECCVIVIVAGAATILAAPPLIQVHAAAPARVAGQQVLSATAALPQDGDLTLGGVAGKTLVGISLRPGQPGTNELLVYVLPREGAKGAADVQAELTIDGRPQQLSDCAPTCRMAHVVLQGGENVQILVDGPEGGTADFNLPVLPAVDAGDLFGRVQQEMHALRSLRIGESLGPTQSGDPLESTYTIQAPNRMRVELGTGVENIFIGGMRYSRQPGALWQVDDSGISIPQPTFVWDGPPQSVLIAPLNLGTDEVDGVETEVVAFARVTRGSPTWFRLWVDEDDMVRQAEMRTSGHFMDHHYSDFNATSVDRPAGPFGVQIPQEF